MGSPQEARNKKRRDEYNANESYRKTCIELSRENYRRENGVVLKSCLDNLEKLDDFGTIREVHIGKTIKQLQSWSVNELAETLGYSATILYRWKGKNLIPGPIIDAKVEIFSKARNISFESTLKVYLEDEVRAIVSIIGEHQKEFCYYRKSDKGVTDSLFSEVEKIRIKRER